MFSRAAFVTSLVFAMGCSTEDAGGGTVGADAGAQDATTTTDAIADDASTSIQASDYDQSCTTRSDCVGIGEGSLCGCGARNAAINVRDLAKEQADAKERRAHCGPPNGTSCGEATATIPVCAHGRCALFDCQADTCPDAGTDGADCASDLDCDANMLCIGARCKPACTDQSECSTGHCNVGAGVCFGPPGCNRPAPYPDGGCSTLCYGYCVEGTDAGLGESGASDSRRRARDCDEAVSPRPYPPWPRRLVFEHGRVAR